MTSQEMQYNFELKAGENNILEKTFSSYDVAMFLNNAQDELVDGFYSSRLRPESRYFEMDERARAMLAFLIESAEVLQANFVTSDAALHQNGVFVNLPSDFLYALKEECTVSYVDCNNTTTTRSSRVLPVTHDEYMLNIDNVYKKPYRDLIWRMDFAGSSGIKKHELISSSDITVTIYRLRYLRKPNRININNGVDCELNEILHDEVVNRALSIALASRQLKQVEQNIES